MKGARGRIEPAPLTALPQLANFSRPLCHCPHPRLLLSARLANVKAVVDDDVMDEDAGAARARMQEATRERRAAEKAERERQNAEMQERIRNTKSKTDEWPTDTQIPLF